MPGSSKVADMCRPFLAVALFAVAAAPLRGDATLKTPDVKPLDDVWEAAYVENDSGVNVKIGYVHLTSAFVGKGEQQLIRTTKELRFTINRGDTPAELKADVSADESADGTVAAVRAKIWLGKDRVQTITATVIEGTKVRVSADGELKSEREFRWDPKCVGLAREQTLLRDKQAKPGDEFTYRYFEPQVTNFVTVRVVIGNAENVVLPGGLKRKLVKAVATPNPLKLGNGGLLQLPAASHWFDAKSYEIVKTQSAIEELGVVTLLRTSKVAALAPNGKVPDLMKRQSIYLSAAVPDIHERDDAVYRITFKGDAKPKELVSTDDRQKIESAEGNTFTLRVTARHRPIKIDQEEKVGDEFLKSNYFITSADKLVQELAERAAGKTRDPWEKAKKIEDFVLHFMKAVDYSEALAPADHVARTAAGDCTEYAMLTAAMCRAQGIPSRTAIGLVYVNNLLGRPGLGFHMWTEVFVKGQWLGLDATRGFVGPGHIKITDHSWDNVISFVPLLPVKGFIQANPAIEVVGK